MARSLAAAALGVLLAAAVVRVAVVQGFGASNPSLAARFWPAHPKVRTSAGLIEIAEAARKGRPVNPDVIERIYMTSIAAPLSEEPFLVRGIQAQIDGATNAAKLAFLGAKWRDGRSLPARYFLADFYFRSGDAKRGLAEVGALSRLAPEGVKSLAPYVATYAKDRTNHGLVRALFRSEPYLEEATLAALSTDPRNADLIISIADPRRLSAKSSWLPGLVLGIANAGNYAKARQVWARASKVEVAPGQLLYDADFRSADAPPPFNWALTSSTVGLAERLPGGGLHIVYYGREDGPLAAQLLALEPGAYRLRAQSAADLTQAPGLRWRVVCASSNREIASAPLSAASGQGLSFVVPGECRGQRLELFGTSDDIPDQADVTIKSLRLIRGA